jgi:hypothetical protein
MLIILDICQIEYKLEPNFLRDYLRHLTDKISLNVEELAGFGVYFVIQSS